ncbi:MAG: ATP-binding protein, partial [Gemmatimonadota bacterium]
QLLGELAELRTRVAELAAGMRGLEERNRALERDLLEYGRTEQRLGEKDRLMMAFREIGQTILSTLDSERILDQMGIQIARAGIFRSLMIAVVNEAGGYVEVVRTFFRTPDGSLLRNDTQIVGLRYALDDSNITAEVARTGQMKIIDEFDQRFDARIDNPQSRRGKVSYFLPVKQRERVVAVLATGSEADEKEAVVSRLEAMSPLLNQMAIALEHARLYEEAQQEIRERQRAERERAALEARLQRVEKMELVGNLAGGVAHDLNNILTAIVGFPDLMLLGLPEDSPWRRPLLSIRKAGEQAAAIVSDLLTMARRAVAVDKVVCLNAVVSEYLESPQYDELRSRFPEVAVEARLAGGLPNVMGSPVHLGETVMNLVANAMEAMPAGGQLVISTENRCLDRPIRGYDEVAQGDYVVLQVSDTGSGVAPEDLDRIFEPFYTKKQMGRSGTGLGMAVVWGAVKDHHGYIDLESALGEGTTFTLYFPVSRERVEKRASPVESAEYMGRGESILVVDDMEEQRQLAAALLEKLGYSVATAAGGDEAVEHLQQRSVDLLVLDMIMEDGMDGLDTFRRILELHPRQRAIIASGFTETDRVREAQRLGAGAFVKKPYLLEKLGMAVRAELDRPGEAPVPG